MDTLVALGSMASFGYSTYALFAMTDAQLRGSTELVMEYMHDFYFESAAMILALITVGKMLEARSKGKTTDALKSLMKLAPKTAVVVRNGAEVTVGIDQVQTGDIFVVRPGENIPVDGVILEGSSAEYPGVYGCGRYGVCAHHQPVRFYPLPRNMSWRGHDSFPDHPDGQRRGCHKGADRQNCS